SSSQRDFSHDLDPASLASIGSYEPEHCCKARAGLGEVSSRKLCDVASGAGKGSRSVNGSLVRWNCFVGGGPVGFSDSQLPPQPAPSETPPCTPPAKQRQRGTFSLQHGPDLAPARNLHQRHRRVGLYRRLVGLPALGSKAAVCTALMSAAPDSAAARAPSTPTARPAHRAPRRPPRRTQSLR